MYVHSCAYPRSTEYSGHQNSADLPFVRGLSPLHYGLRLVRPQRMSVEQYPRGCLLGPQIWSVGRVLIAGIGRCDDKMSKIQLEAGIYVPKTTQVSMRRGIRRAGRKYCVKRTSERERWPLYWTLHTNQPSCINLLEMAGYTLLHFLRRLAGLRRDHKPHALQLHEPRLGQRAPQRWPIEPVEVLRSEDVGNPKVDFFDVWGGDLGYHERDPFEGGYPSKDKVERPEVRAVGYCGEKICAICFQKNEGG
jgi:hypothetical protein